MCPLNLTQLWDGVTWVSFHQINYQEETGLKMNEELPCSCQTFIATAQVWVPFAVSKQTEWVESFRAYGALALYSQADDREISGHTERWEKIRGSGDIKLTSAFYPSPGPLSSLVFLLHWIWFWICISCRFFLSIFSFLPLPLQLCCYGYIIISTWSASGEDMREKIKSNLVPNKTSFIICSGIYWETVLCFKVRKTVSHGIDCCFLSKICLFLKYW